MRCVSIGGDESDSERGGGSDGDDGDGDKESAARSANDFVAASIRVSTAGRAEKGEET
jgi:hypothetical protein